MNKPTLGVFISGVFLVTCLVQTGCAKQSSKLSSYQEDTHPYLITMSNTGNLTTDYDVVFYDSLENPDPLPDSIVHFLLLSKGSISGIVWKDNNGNRLIDVGESGMKGIRVYVDNDGSKTFTNGDQYEYTDINGLYAIERVKSGIKNVYIDPASLTGPYEITTYHPYIADLETKKEVNDADFGMRDISGSINGTLWDQTDDVPVSGVIVYLTLEGTNAFIVNERTGTTDASGNYLFSNIPGDDYYVYVDTATLDEKYVRTPVEGTDPAQVVLPPGESMSVDFSYIQQATISGVVSDEDGNGIGYVTLYIDLNGNGVYDEGEPLAITDENGYYIFDQLLPGTYTILILESRLPAGYETAVSPGTITIESGDNFTADGTTQTMPVTITGYVWDDTNGNGVREPEENGLADITVFLDDNNNGIQDGGEPAIATDTSGTYLFTGIKHGDFYIRADDSTLLNAYVQTTKSNPVYWEIAPGQSYDRARFGYQGKLVPAHTLHFPTRLSWGADGNLYVSDSSNNSVFIHDSSLNVLGELKGLAKPLGVTADDAGNIYVGNQDRQNVEVYDSYGNLLRSIGDGTILKPNSLALDRDNNLYVMDTDNDTVLVYDQGGTLISEIGDTLPVKHGVSLAISYRDDGSGTGTEIGEVYVADQQTCSIHVFSLDGIYNQSIGGCGSLLTSNWDGLFAGIMAVDIDPYGYVHGLDNNLNVVQVFDPQDGTFLRSYNAYTVENENNLNMQADITIHPIDKRVVINNAASRSVEMIATVPAP